MLISNKNTNDFDLSEIIAELEMPERKYKPLKPLKSGTRVHDFVLLKDNINKRRFFNGTETNSSVLLRRFSGKPLVISFYSSQWQQHGVQHLKQLNILQKEIKALGANLLIITPDEGGKVLEEIVWDNSLALNFYFDHENLIAEKLGIFSDHDPAWNKYAGIEINVPLLATYVLDQANNIVFDHIDHNLQGRDLSSDLLNAVYAAGTYGADRKSA